MRYITIDYPMVLICIISDQLVHRCEDDSIPDSVVQDDHEAKLLYSAYKQTLLLAKENRLSSIGFPLISAGIFGYPLVQAWSIAIQACIDFIRDNTDYEMNIVFAVLDDEILSLGQKTLEDLS